MHMELLRGGAANLSRDLFLFLSLPFLFGTKQGESGDVLFPSPCPRVPGPGGNFQKAAPRWFGSPLEEGAKQIISPLPFIHFYRLL